MKNLKTIGLLLFLAIGFILPSCDNDDDEIIRDSCFGVEFKNYFDVQGLDVLSFTDFNLSRRVQLGDTISLDQLDRVFIDYVVEYTTSIPPKADWSFSLMPSSYACSYVAGTQGSREEGLVNFTITTLNDFDADHPANSSINDLFDYYGGFWPPADTIISLDHFLAEQPELLESEDMQLKLIKAPELDSEFHIKVVMELSTGEIYEAESMPIFITP